MSGDDDYHIVFKVRAAYDHGIPSRPATEALGRPCCMQEMLHVDCSR
jgi:hypothetical protein